MPPFNAVASFCGDGSGRRSGEFGERFAVVGRWHGIVFAFVIAKQPIGLALVR